MTSNRIARRSVLAGAMGVALSGWRAHAQQPLVQVNGEDDDLSEPVELLDAWVDAYGRPTAKVEVNGQGPYNFLVDTGSSMSLVTERVLQEVGGTPDDIVRVHGTTGDVDMPVAIVRSLSTGVVEAKNLRVAVLADHLLRGQHGILGTDVFTGRRLTFDILNKSVSVGPSRSRIRSPMTPGVNITLRNGLLAEISGFVGNSRARLMLDTGADYCLASRALAERLPARNLNPALRRRVIVHGITGHSMTGTYMSLPNVHMGTAIVRDSGAVLVNSPVFKVWGYDREPVLIVGVNVLSRLASFTIDYGARRFESELMAVLPDIEGARLA